MLETKKTRVILASLALTATTVAGFGVSAAAATTDQQVPVTAPLEATTPDPVLRDAATLSRGTERPAISAADLDALNVRQEAMEGQARSIQAQQRAAQEQARRDAAAKKAAADAAAAAAAKKAAADQAKQAATLGYSASTKDPRGIAKQMMQNKYNWGANQFACYNTIIMAESEWKVDADNPTSSAYGIPQALPGKKMASAGADWKTNPATQIKWSLGYIQDRYGTPCQALTFRKAHNWY